jgi:N-acetylmuramidase
MHYAATLFSAIEARDEAAQWRLLQSLSEFNAVAAATSLGPNRLRTLLYRFVGQSKAVIAVPLKTVNSVSTGMAGPISRASNQSEALVHIVLAKAFKDASFLGRQRDAALESRVQQHLVLLHSQRAAKPLIELYRDVTHTLLPPTMCFAPISDVQYAEVAKSLDIEVAAIKAIASVESSGEGYDTKGRPIVRLEAHWFKKLTNNLYDQSHPHLSNTTPASYRYGNWSNQYSRLYEAIALDSVAAIKATSWGQFQVMGFNHNGWPDPVSFARAMQADPVNQLKTFAAYLRDRKLVTHIQKKDWASVALGYNGGDYAVNKYDTRMAAAYKKYGGR